MSVLKMIAGSSYCSLSKLLYKFSSYQQYTLLCIQIISLPYPFPLREGNCGFLCVKKKKIKKSVNRGYWHNGSICADKSSSEQVLAQVPCLIFFLHETNRSQVVRQLFAHAASTVHVVA